MFSTIAISVHFGILHVAHDNRHFVQARELCGAPLAFTGNNLVVSAIGRVAAHQNGLDHAFLFDGFRKLLQHDGRKIAAWLIGAGREQFDRGLAGRSGYGRCGGRSRSTLGIELRVIFGGFWQQGAKALPSEQRLGADVLRVMEMLSSVVMLRPLLCGLD